MLHVNSHKNFMLELWILHILKLHRKTVLQLTPSSDTPASGTPIFFSTWYGGQLLEKEEEKKRHGCWIFQLTVYLFVTDFFNQIFFSTNFALDNALLSLNIP